MGLLFWRKKKIPKVPLPVGKPVDEKELKFPTAPSKEKVIAPDKVKEAVGIKKEQPEVKPPTPLMKPRFAPKLPQEQLLQKEEGGPLYVKMDVYQRVLGELDGLKSDITHLHEANRKLESSEYNEEKNFDKLRRGMKAIHDRLLQADVILFKPQGD